ncbi:hypothetical protein BgiMline_027286 [Biomphalaria glabrata]
MTIAHALKDKTACPSVSICQHRQGVWAPVQKQQLDATIKGHLLHPTPSDRPPLPHVADINHPPPITPEVVVPHRATTGRPGHKIVINFLGTVYFCYFLVFSHVRSVI